MTGIRSPFPAAIVAWALIGTMGYSSFLGLPVLLGVLADARHLDEAALGWIGSAEMAGLLVGSVAAARLLPRLSAAKLAVVGAMVAILGNCVTALPTTGAAIAASRLLAGAGGGLCYGLACGRLAVQGSATRNFSLLTFLMVLQTAILFVGLPWAREWGGLPGVTGLLVASLAVAILATPFAKQGTQAPQDSSTPKVSIAQGDRDLLHVGVWCLGLALLFGVAIGGIWTFIERVGSVGGLDIGTTGRILAISNLVGLPTCWAAARAERMISAKWALTGSLLAGGISLVVWRVGQDSVASYALQATVIGQCLTFAQVYLLAMLGRTDPTGGQAAFSPAAIGGGLVIGPAMAASIAALSSLRIAYAACGVLLIILAAACWWAQSRIDRLLLGRATY